MRVNMGTILSVPFAVGAGLGSEFRFRNGKSEFRFRNSGSELGLGTGVQSFDSGEAVLHGRVQADGGFLNPKWGSWIAPEGFRLRAPIAVHTFVCFGLGLEGGAVTPHSDWCYGWVSFCNC